MYNIIHARAWLIYIYIFHASCASCSTIYSTTFRAGRLPEAFGWPTSHSKLTCWASQRTRTCTWGSNRWGTQSRNFEGAYGILASNVFVKWREITWMQKMKLQHSNYVRLIYLYTYTFVDHIAGTEKIKFESIYIMHAAYMTCICRLEPYIYICIYI